VNRCDGNAFHLAMTSGPSKRQIRTAKHLARQNVWVCGFSYVKGKDRGFLTLLIPPTPMEKSLVKEQIDSAMDQFVELIQKCGRAGGVYKLNQTGQVVSIDA